MIDAGHGGRHSAGRNILLRFAAIYGASAILGMGTYYGYRFYCESNNNGFLKGTTVDGEDVSGMSVKAARELILDKYADSEIVITENENEDLKGNLAYFGYEIDQDKLQKDLQTAFETEKSDRMAVLRSIFDRFEYEIEAAPQENTAVFEKVVTADHLEVARYPSQDAALYYDPEADAVAISEEIRGNEISDKDLQNFVRDCIKRTLEEEESLHAAFEFPWDLCEKPGVYRDDEELVTKRDAINAYAGAGITYTFGKETQEYDLLDIFQLSQSFLADKDFIAIRFKT